MAGTTGPSRLANLPSDLLDDHAPAFLPQWMTDNKHIAAHQQQADRNHGVSDIPAWSNEGRVDKPAWQDEKPRENHRWDKPGGGAFSERPKSYPGVEEPPRGALHSGGGAMGGKWREDSDRVPVRRDLPRWGPEERGWGNVQGTAREEAFAGPERWEPKGRGRGIVEPVRRGLHDNFADRWGPPAARAEKWGPAEGDGHDPHGERWGHRTSPGAPGAPGFGSPGYDVHHHGPDAGRGRGFAAGRGRGLHVKGPVGAPGAIVGGHDKWVAGAQVAAPGHVTPMPAVVVPGPAPALGSRTAKHVYRKAEAVAVYKQLKASAGLTLPKEVDRDDPTLFAEAGQADVLEVLAGVHEPGNGGEPPFTKAVTTPTAAVCPAAVTAGTTDGGNKGGKDLAISSSQQDKEKQTDKPQGEATGVGKEGPAAAQDEKEADDSSEASDAWVYRDPQGDLQGPFTRADIVEWYEGNFFPADLPIRSAKDPPESPFRPLATMLKAWGMLQAGPPGFVGMAQPQSQPKEKAEEAATQQPSTDKDADQDSKEAKLESQNLWPAAAEPIRVSEPQPSLMQSQRPETSRFEHVFAESQNAQRAQAQKQAEPQPQQPAQISPPQQQQIPQSQQQQAQPSGLSPLQHLFTQQPQPLHSAGFGFVEQRDMPGHQATSPYANRPDQGFASILGLPPNHNPLAQSQADPLFQIGLEAGRQALNSVNPAFPMPQPQQHQLHSPWAASQQQHILQAAQLQQQAQMEHQAARNLPFTARVHEHHPQHAQQVPLPQHLFAPGPDFLQMPPPQQQQPPPQKAAVADPVIDPSRVLPMNRAASNNVQPIGPDSRGSSSNNLVQQASGTGPSNLADLFPFLQTGQQQSLETHLSQLAMHQQQQPEQNQHYPSHQPQASLPQPQLHLEPSSAPSEGLQLGGRPSPLSQAHMQDAARSQAPLPIPLLSSGQPLPENSEVSAKPAAAPFEKVKHKQRKPAKQAATDLEGEKAQAYQPLFASFQPAQPGPPPKRITPQQPQPQPQPEERRPAVESRPAPWAHAVPATKPGQKSLLDIQREEAERAAAQAAAEAAQAAEAAASGAPMHMGPAGGWAKVAGAGGATSHSGNGRDVAMERAMAASLRDIQEHEERVRRQVQQSQRETIGVNGEPAEPRGGTLADAFRDKGLVSPPTFATWNTNAAAKLAKDEQQRKKAQQQQQQKPSHPAAQKDADEDEAMFWDYGNDHTKHNGKAQPANGAAAGAAAKRDSKQGSASSAAQQGSRGSEEDQPFAGVPMSPAFEEWCKEKMKKLQGTDDLTLVRFLMSCSSNGEIVEYISAYLGKSTEVSQFTSEFIRRKFEEAAGKKGKKGNEPAGGVQKQHPGVTAAGAGGGVPAATGWQKLPAKGKKKKDKGRKVDMGMLGFETGVQYDLLERGDA